MSERTQFEPTPWLDIKTGERKWGIKAKRGGDETWYNVSEEDEILFFISREGVERKIKELNIRHDSKLTFFPSSGDLLVFSQNENFSAPMVGKFLGYEIGISGFAIGYQAGGQIWSYARRLTEDEELNMEANGWLS